MPNPPVNDVTSHPDGTKTVRVTRLRAAILATGKPNYVVGASCGIHHSTLSLYAQGKKEMQPAHLKALSRHLKKPPADLVGWLSYTLDAEGNVRQ